MMNEWLIFLKDSLIISGAIILALAITPVWKLFQQLPKTKLRLQWGFLISLILVFIVGYLAFWQQSQQKPVDIESLTVPFVFFCGSIFVLMVNHLSLKTTKDMMQIYTLKRDSITDPLLGIFNRRYLDKRLSEEISQAQKYQHPLSLFIIDIDHFKKVNDTYGHQVGDQALQHIAKLVKNAIRDFDIVARYGGEELVVILPKTEPCDGHKLAERLRNIIATQPIKLSNHNDGSEYSIEITASIGITGLTQSNAFNDDLIQSADKALYQAKQGGRNLVMLNESLALSS